MTVFLKGIGWDHPRGFECLVESTELFHREHPGIRVDWSKRSLRDFGEAPIDVLAEDHDLIIIDHPFSGKARQSGCLQDLFPIVPDVVERLKAEAVGQSARSYHFDGGVWGLPTDAASQVASYRPDLFARIGANVPQSHAEVLELTRSLRAADMWIGAPSCPTDAICQVLSYAANLGHPPGAAEGEFLPPDVLCDVLEILKEVVSLAHPASVESNPIQMFERMLTSDEIAYIPLAFSYSNYARQGRAPLIFGADFAGPGPDPKAGALLGGAGFALSSRCREVEAAATFLRWLHRPEVMAGVYFEAGGQPGLRSVWLDDTVNAKANGFFANTLDTMERAFLRPRFDGFVPFMESAGFVVNTWLRDGSDPIPIVAKLRALYSQAYDQTEQVA